MTVVEFI